VQIVETTVTKKVERRPFEVRPADNGGWIVFVGGHPQDFGRSGPAAALGSDKALLDYLKGQLGVK
jgi:hypothetical protein